MLMSGSDVNHVMHAVYVRALYVLGGPIQIVASQSH